MLEKKLILIELFDEYQLLLTEKQRQIFLLHFHEDFSFSEIAIDLGITKQAVADALKKSVDQLELLEQKLRLLEKQHCRINLLNQLNNLKCSDSIQKIISDLRNI